MSTIIKHPANFPFQYFYILLAAFVVQTMMPELSTAQKLGINTNHFFGGNGCITGAKDAIFTKDKAVVFTGSSNCNAQDDIPDVQHGLLNLVVGKVDTNAKLQWVSVFGGSGDDEGITLIQTQDGGYAVLGTTLSADGDVPSAHATGGIKDIWLIKLDAGGRMQWSKTFGGNGQNLAMSLVEKEGGGFMILGAANAVGNDIPSVYYNAPDRFDWFVVSLDAQGNKQWLKMYGGTGYEGTAGKLLVGLGHYYIVSNTTSTDHDCIDTSWHPKNKPTLNNVYVLKLDTLGDILRGNSYGGTDAEYVQSAVFDPVDTSITFAGSTGSSDIMVSGHKGMGDMWIAKVSGSGKIIWSYTYGTAQPEMNAKISRTSDGYLVYCKTLSPYGGNPALFTIFDTWLYVLDAEGKKLADKIIGGTQVDEPVAVISHNNSILAVGTTASMEFSEGASIGRKGTFDNVFITNLHYFPVGINDPYNNSCAGCSLYPNPVDANGVLALSGFPSGSALYVDVYNTIGQKLQVIPVPAGGSINLGKHHIPTGTYFFALRDGDGTVLFHQQVLVR